MHCFHIFNARCCPFCADSGKEMVELVDKQALLSLPKHYIDLFEMYVSEPLLFKPSNAYFPFFWLVIDHFLYGRFKINTEDKCV